MLYLWARCHISRMRRWEKTKRVIWKIEPGTWTLRSSAFKLYAHPIKIHAHPTCSFVYPFEINNYPREVYAYKTSSALGTNFNCVSINFKRLSKDFKLQCSYRERHEQEGLLLLVQHFHQVRPGQVVHGPASSWKELLFTPPEARRGEPLPR